MKQINVGKKSTGPEEKPRKAISFTSSVPASFLEEVEDLFFFNPKQASLGKCIYQTIQRTGIPRIIEMGGQIWIGVPSGALQCLFAWNGPPGSKIVGVALYGRRTADLLSIVHLAVHGEYVRGAGNGDWGVIRILIRKITKIAERIQGVTCVKLPYREEGIILL